MTKRRQKALQRYVDKLLPLFGLDHWTVVVSEKAPPEGNLAWFFAVKGQRYGLLRVENDTFFDLEPKDQRQTILHELLHAHDAPIAFQMQNVLPKIVRRKDAYDAFYATWDQQVEYFTDHLATILAPHFPLPELPR